MTQVNRRTALTTLLAASGTAAFATGTRGYRGQGTLPKTGTDDPAFAPFDERITSFMREKGIPGASLAVVDQGRLVYARGYGWADKAAQLPYEPTHRFRIASVSKPVTSAAIVALVQQGKLNLEEKAFDLLKLEAHLEPGATVDPRLKNITVRHLLHHSGGFDRGASFDPMFAPRKIAASLGVASPPGPRDIVRYMMGRPLDFDPGTHYAYSNFGYCVLGRIIETLTGGSYEDYVQKTVLKPIGVTRMRLGRSRFSDRAEGEVHYYDGDDRRVPSVFGTTTGATVPASYGGWCIESMDAHGGWLASAVDLARFAASLDTPNSGLGLTRKTLTLLYERPASPLGAEADGRPSPAFYGLGWMVRPTTQGRANYWHSGKLSGSSSLLVRRDDGRSWVLNFNTESKGAESLASLLDGPLHSAANAVRAWPTQDRFAQFGITV